MRHPDSILPLLIALVIAGVLHAALLPVGAAMLDRPAELRVPPQLEIVIGPTPAESAPGQTLEVTALVRNVGGTTATVTTWTTWALSRDTVWDADDELLPDQTPRVDKVKPRDLWSGGEYDDQGQLTIPSGYEGPVFLLGRVESENAEPATAHRSIWIDSPRPAAVSVDSVDARESAIAGGALSIGYTLRNAEDAGWAKAGWADRVVLSPDAEVSGDDLVLLNVPRRRPLGPGASTSAGPFELHIPLGVMPGDYHLIVQSGAPGTEAEPWAQTLRIEPATHPDLAPRNLKLSSGETQLTLGQPTALSFDVVNRSPLPAPNVLWGDRVYWSVDDQPSPDDVVLVSEPRGAYPGLLPGGGRYRSGPHEILISPDMVLSSTMHLIVVTDDENDLVEGDYEGNNALAMEINIKQPVEAEQPEELKLGRDDEPARVTVAWIAHDDFQDLLARESVTLQPILQDQVDPTPNAPLERDPEDTGQQASAAAQPTPPTPNPAHAPTPASQQIADTARDPLDPARPGDLPTADPGAVDQLGNAPQDTPGIPLPVPTSPQSPPETPPTVASQDEGDKPTSAPRSDREVDPTQLINAKSVRPGQVLVGPGLEVKTFRPNWSAAARFTIPRNPEVVITFDTDGTVLQADLTTSTGFKNVDGPLLSSLYRWKATGDRLDDFEAPFQIELTVLLGGSEVPEDEEDEESP
ncbi:MAG: hypothetical protein AAF593_08625 [Planctomycetota bacterium]